jgi:hypothetical protein
MAGINRRTFLTRGSLTVAAAGVLASVPAAVLPGVLAGTASEAPALPSLVGGAASELPAVEADLAELAGGADGPLVAHVRDAATGEIGLYSGTREVILRDPELAGRLLRAAK